MFPAPWKYAEEKKLLELSTKNEPFRPAESSQKKSKEPIVCPHMNCHCHIAILRLSHHFLHEHKDVPFIKTALEAPISIEINLNEVKYNGITCITLIGPLDTEVKKFCPDLEDDEFLRPTLIVMAVKLAAFPISNSNAVASKSESSLKTASTKTFNYCPIDKIIVWVAANTPVKLSYTLCATSSHSSKRIKYFGPIPTLYEKHSKIAAEGKGLTLYQNHIFGMSPSSNSTIYLNALIHE